MLGRVNDIVLYRQLMARGVSEYLVAPFSVVEFVAGDLPSVPRARAPSRSAASSRWSAPRAASAPRRSRTISPGTLADRLDMATIIADFDLGFGTAGLDFNQDPPQGVAEAVFAPERVDANLVDRLLSKCGDNLTCSPRRRCSTASTTSTRPRSIRCRHRCAPSTPWIVLDIPHAWTAWTRRMLVGADEVIVVAAPDLANLRNAKNIMDNIRGARPHDHPPRLVLNGVGMPKRPEISVADFTKTIEIEPIAIIPHDAKLFGSAANNGQMIAEIEPKGTSRRDFRRSRRT